MSHRLDPAPPGRTPLAPSAALSPALSVVPAEAGGAERYRALAEAVTDVVWTTDAAGLVEDLPGWRRLTGQSVEAVRGTGWADALHPDDRARVERVWRAACESGTRYDAEYRLRMADGAYRRFRARAVPVRHPDGTVREWVGALDDVEEARRAEEAVQASEARYRSLVEATAVGVWRSGADGAFETAQPSWGGYTGQPAEAQLGWGCLEMFHPDDRLGVRDAWRSAVAGGEAYAAEARLWHAAAGEYRWCVARAVPVRAGDGRVVEWIGTFADVDDRKRADAALVVARAEAEAHLLEAERARARAERLREAAEQANEAKAEFLSTMSHELRTPLNAIGGYVELLEMGVRGPITPEQARDLARIRMSARVLLALVNDILNFARLDAGRVEFRAETVPLDRALASLDALVAPQVRARRIGFTWEVAPGADGRPLAARADPERLRQVLLNLLTNAVKFTEPGGAIAVVCDAADGAIRVRVRDTGRGIAAHQLERVFEPFVQVDRHLTHESQQGVGLGLAISRDLARRMGGDLTAESAVGVGSTFTLTLPMG